MKNLNREIEFRAWDIEKKRMLQNVSSMLNNSSFILMQYIGKKDSSGKKIYEGDILKTNEGDWSASVIYRGTHFVLALGNEGGFSTEPNWDKCTIRGNIYENPGLMSWI